MKVACVEKRDTLGGTCLNVGCIPSKALLNPRELFDEARHGLAAHGIKVGERRARPRAMMARKDKVVDAADPAASSSCSRRTRSTAFKGTGRIDGAGRVAVLGADGAARTRAAKNILIATGRKSTPLPGVDDRREADRLLDRRARARRGAGAPGRGRRRRHRARAGLGVAAARRRGDRGRVPRPHRARHGRRDRASQFQRAAREAGPDVQARHQGHRGRRRRTPASR